MAHAFSPVLLVIKKRRGSNGHAVLYGWLVGMGTYWTHTQIPICPAACRLWQEKGLCRHWLAFFFHFFVGPREKEAAAQRAPAGFDGIVSKPRRARQKRGHQKKAAKCSNGVNNLVSYLFGPLQKCRQQNVLVLVCLPFLAGKTTRRRLFCGLFFLLFLGRWSHTPARTKSPTGMSGPFFC